MKDKSTHSPPSMRSRLFALIVGPGYLFFHACLLGSATQTSIAIALALTLLAALTVMAVLAALGAKAYEYKQSAVRFTLSTAFLVSVPLCIYLAAVRCVLQSIPASQLDWLAWPLIAGFATIWMCLTTVVLLWLAEAIVWLAVAVRRWLATKRTRGSP